MKQLQKISAFFVAIIMAMAISACAPTTTTEGTGGYIDDTVITTKVKSALLATKGLKSNEINVETFKGRVQLSGFVNSPEEIKQAIQVAREIKGVNSVINSIKLR
ncbi:BON domain-containing protein [Xenorhabdus mauleonii]|uniref:Osmotically-inducible protein Y n=1 Tax=Xenorhabdus mauleonii TaxID=351675 RepID=A0A1I3MBE3_9GAMM|nr:BON domain-containing protein [Xenorhabdus mauleonii]PHM45457.1 BON domain-containing protein [Xenorhabdus mauleonii]SFI94247.1 BON domain-containing protein [Xenorhabdus mauleonii]